MKKLNKFDIEFLIEALKSRKEIPLEYKYALFPTKQKEYELVYAGKMRKEDILADNEEAKAVPLQVEKIFNGKKYPLFTKNWHNFLVFGDNLQILKTFNKNSDPLIKNKIKGKVKLIYIDPPFATESDFKSKDGAKAYTDKTKGSEFIEFLRKRLIVAREILADDGTIFVHLDTKKGHYIKLVLDEIFGESNFLNEVIWQKINNPKKQSSSFGKVHDIIFVYSKSGSNTFNQIFTEYDEKYVTNTYKYIEEKTERKFGSFDLTQKGSGPIRYFGKKYGDLKPPKGKHWIWGQERIDEALKKNLIIFTKNGTPRVKKYLDEMDGKVISDLWTDILNIQANSNENIDYPTQKPEKLIERIIKASTNEGDLILDFFCGSGSTLAVAEKLGRRWVGCDIGKLAIYTTQKRLLNIDQSKDIENPKIKYGKPAKSFGVVTSGLYNLSKIFALKKDEYVDFVKRLFEIDERTKKKISGVEIDGKKREFYVKIFPYWDLKNVSVDEKYLKELHKSIGNKIDSRFYIIAPANNVDFISDYHQIGNVRYYFLKVPYQIIKELHKVQFKKLRQPQSKKNINDLDEAIGFHFIRQPEVKSEIKKIKDKIVLRIKKFESAYSKDETGEKLVNFGSLAMLLVDLNYNGEAFLMTDYYFADELLDINKDKTDDEIKAELKKKRVIKKEFIKKDCGKKIMAIYVDIYGNEFKEIFKI